ncbi:MAG: ATP-dependent sacrificial sulfur transferase LarE, partial [Candidatus Helarchaeales archaeon]
ESDVLSPYLEVGMTKKEIRELARKLDLECWNVPSSACLASRIPYGEKITPEKLEMIELAETYLKQHYSITQVRVRHHGDLARIEVPLEEMKKILDVQKFSEISTKLQDIGFRFVTLDMKGYRSGSMDEKLMKESKTP